MENNEHPDFVTTYKSVGGWKAVLLIWTDIMGGFYEPWNSGYFAFEDEKKAIIEAKEWAIAEEVEYRERS